MSEPTVQVVAAPIFARFLKHLARKYRSIRQDLAPLLQQLENGETPGDQIQGVQYPVYKVRVKNSDVPKGKSGGYRVVYYVKTPKRLILLAIYAKTERVDIQPEHIRHMIEAYEQSLMD
jgi:mRNA-degrading endonuclease RelE of RelBE toxin-antitoxin system